MIESLKTMTGAEFAALTMGQLYDMVEQSSEPLMFCLMNDGDGKPFALFALAIDKPERLEEYAKALERVRPNARNDAVVGALNG